MSLEDEIKFGWIPAPAEKRHLHAEVYAWRLAVPMVVASVEKVTTLDPRFVQWYDQDGKNACVGASWAKVMATINTPQVGAQQYSWWEIYCEACRIDNDAQTTCARDIGTYIFAGGDVLRKKGAFVAGSGWNLELGLDRYFWAQSIDDMRTAISIGQLLEFGVPWFSGWMNPVKDAAGRYWLPARSKWGKILGGHGIGGYDALDSAQGIGWSNTWGSGYPEKVYVKYTDVEYLLNTLGAECAVAVDKAFTPPEPPPTDKIMIDLALTENNVKYVGTGIELMKV